MGEQTFNYGPYYYAYWKDAESKKLKKKYIGTRGPKTSDITELKSETDNSNEI